MTRPQMNQGRIEWDLPEGFELSTMRLRKWEGHPHVEVYVTYSQTETIEGKPFLISTGQTGHGNDFEEALTMALTKAIAAVEDERKRRAMIAHMQPEPLPSIDFSKLDLSL